MRTTTVALALLLCAARAAADEVPPADAPVQTVTVPGRFVSEMRPYAHFVPGIREYAQQRQLAPDSELRFGLVTGSFPMKPLPLAKASLEASGWSQPLTVQDDGWFLLPDVPEAVRRNAKLVISKRKGTSAVWTLDVHTPGLPAQTYRLGDLRLECRVYLAIEWGKWQGRRIMGEEVSGVTTPPMDELCNGPQAVFFNTRPWPRLQGYVISEGARSLRHALDRHDIRATSLMLQLASDTERHRWSDDALVEFQFYDASHWSKATSIAPPGQAAE